MSKRTARAFTRTGRRLLVGGTVAASTVIGSGAIAPTAHADYDDAMSFGAGAFFGYRFGTGAQASARSGFEWGLEAFATHRFTGVGCTGDERLGVGPLLQVAVLGLSEPRLTLAAQGGGELARMGFALSGELGLSYGFGPNGGLGIHTGILPETIYLNAGLSYQWLLDQGSINGGLRVMPTYGEPMSCAVGRPLRSDHGVLQLSAVQRAGAQRAVAREHEPRTRAAGTRPSRGAVEPVGQAFARDAQNELSSVPAFLQLASELVHAGAPASLVQRALQAARDEQLHTALCAQLAQRHLGHAIALGLPELAQRRQLNRAENIARLAAESWLDGCVAEGSAAAHAVAAAERAGDPHARTTLARIAADEQRHAELAWDILGWALTAGGEQARAAVQAARTHTGEPREISAELAPEGLSDHGRLGAHALNAVARAHFAASETRLTRCLA